VHARTGAPGLTSAPVTAAPEVGGRLPARVSAADTKARGLHQGSAYRNSERRVEQELTRLVGGVSTIAIAL
jgi:hypothetical protein